MMSSVSYVCLMISISSNLCEGGSYRIYQTWRIDALITESVCVRKQTVSCDMALHRRSLEYIIWNTEDRGMKQPGICTWQLLLIHYYTKEI